MSITTDESFLAAVRDADKIQPRSLWQHLSDIAAYLTLLGANDEAYHVWKLAYSGLVPVPDFSRKSAHCYAASLCHLGKLPDISLPYRSDPDPTKQRTLSQWVARQDASTYRSLLVFPYATPFVTKPLEHLRTGFDLARPIKGERSSPTELEALASFDALITDPQQLSRSLKEVHLIYADIAYRHNDLETAKEHLRLWKTRATDLNTTLHAVLSLKTTSRLAYAGTLADTSAIPPSERRSMVETLVRGLAIKLSAPAESFSYPTELEFPVFYSTLSFGPADDSIYEAEWDLNLLTKVESPQRRPTDSYPRFITLGLESGTAKIYLKSSPYVPEDTKTGNWLAFPLQVIANPTDGVPSGRRGTVFPSSPTCPIDDVGFNISPGEYDVLAKLSFVPEEDVPLVIWSIHLSFLPRGTVPKHGILHWDKK